MEPHSSARFAERLEPLGLKLPHVGILMAIELTDGLSQQALCDRLGVFSSRLVGLIDDLEGSGQVEPRYKPADRSSFSHFMTEAGRATLEQILRRRRRNSTGTQCAPPSARRSVLCWRTSFARIVAEQGLTPGVHPSASKSSAMLNPVAMRRRFVLTPFSFRRQGPSVAASASQGQAGPTGKADPAADERQPVPVEERLGRLFFDRLPDDPVGLEAAQERFGGELGFRDRAEAAFRDLQERRPLRRGWREARRGEGPEYRASSLVVVIVSDVERLAELPPVTGADHEQVIGVEDKRIILGGRGL